MQISKSQINKLGERLGAGSTDLADHRMLDEYRRHFSATLDEVVRLIHEQLELEVTTRVKTSVSIIAKLRRGEAKLGQMQDIAGCRIVLHRHFDGEPLEPELDLQDRILASLKGMFEKAKAFDRRRVPRNGYRAVHVIVSHDEAWAEIQLRTEAQDLWAEVSQGLADVLDPSLKYGGGNAEARNSLLDYSRYLMQCEEIYRLAHRLEHAFGEWDAGKLLFQPDSIGPKDRIVNIYEEMIALSDTLQLDRPILAEALEEIKVSDASRQHPAIGRQFGELRGLIATKAANVLESLQEVLQGINALKRNQK